MSKNNVIEDRVSMQGRIILNAMKQRDAEIFGDDEEEIEKELFRRLDSGEIKIIPDPAVPEPSQKIVVGTHDFKELITYSDIFVDKSLFIQDVIDSGSPAILIMRPYGWGKSLALDMLATFLSIEVDDHGNKKAENSNRKFFTGGEIDLGSGEKKTLKKLKIGTVDDGEYLNAQGQFPVIHISLEDIPTTSLASIEHGLKDTITKLFSRYRYLESSEHLHPYEIARFQQYFLGNISHTELTSTLPFLTKLLYKHHGQEIYILVDEYDAPVNHLLSNDLTSDDKNLHHEASLLLTDLFEACGKGNKYLQKIILMGTFNVFTNGIGGGFNNLVIHGIADAEFSNSFGFSKEEVNTLVEQLDFGNQTAMVKSNMKNWYDGYTIPLCYEANIEVHMPWAVMNYLSSGAHGDFEPQGYWLQGSIGNILQKLLNKETCLDSKFSKKLSQLVSENSTELAFNGLMSLFHHGLNTSNDKVQFSGAQCIADKDFNFTDC